MNNYKIDSIIRNNELDAFLLGEGSKYSNIRPEIDYQRWMEISEYYQALDVGNPDRSFIRERLLSFLQSSNPIAIAVSLEISTLIGLIEVEPHLISIFERLDVLEKDDLLWISACRAIVRLRLERAMLNLIPVLIENNALIHLFQASTEPRYDPRPKDSEVWIMRQLSRAYETGSSPQNQGFYDALEIVMTASKVARRAARGFLLETKGEQCRFCEVVKAVLPSEVN